VARQTADVNYPRCRSSTGCALVLSVGHACAVVADRGMIKRPSACIAEERKLDTSLGVRANQQCEVAQHRD